MIDYFYYRKYITPYFREPKKKAYTMLGLTLLSLSIFGSLAIRPALSVVFSLQRELEEAKEADRKLDEKISALATLQNQYKKAKKDLYLLDVALPETGEVPQLLETLTLFSGRSHVTIRSIRFSKPKVKDNPILAQGTLDMVILGSFSEVLEFLRLLENNLRQINVDNIQFSIEKGGIDNILRVNLKVNTFVYIKS